MTKYVDRIVAVFSCCHPVSILKVYVNLCFWQILHPSGRHTLCGRQQLSGEKRGQCGYAELGT